MWEGNGLHPPTTNLNVFERWLCVVNDVDLMRYGVCRCACVCVC